MSNKIKFLPLNNLSYNSGFLVIGVSSKLVLLIIMKKRHNKKVEYESLATNNPKDIRKMKKMQTKEVIDKEKGLIKEYINQLN